MCRFWYPKCSSHHSIQHLFLLSIAVFLSLPLPPLLISLYYVCLFLAVTQIPAGLTRPHCQTFLLTTKCVCLRVYFCYCECVYVSTFDKVVVLILWSAVAHFQRLWVYRYLHLTVLTCECLYILMNPPVSRWSCH